MVGEVHADELSSLLLKEDGFISDDGVSALSGIGNDSIEDRKKKRANRNRGDTRGVRYYSNSVCMKCFLSILQGSFS